MLSAGVVAALLVIGTRMPGSVESGLARLRVDAATPPRPPDASTSRVLPAVGAGAHAGGFSFTLTGKGGPATYDPCRPIHIVVNTRFAPPGGDRILSSALARVSEATGLSLVLDGPTDEEARVGRPAVDRDRYGNRWSPVLIAWTDPSRIPALAGDTVGVAGSTARRDHAGRLTFVTGTAYLDGPAMTTLLAKPDGRARVEALVMHELGHLVGLAHSEDPDSLMRAEYTGVVDFDAADRAGLAALGSGHCQAQF